MQLHGRLIQWHKADLRTQAVLSLCSRLLQDSAVPFRLHIAGGRSGLLHIQKFVETEKGTCFSSAFLRKGKNFSEDH